MGRTAKTVTISLPPELARRVDQRVRKEGRTRSELFRVAILRYLDDLERWRRLTALSRKRGRELGVTEDEILEAVMEDRRKRRAWGSGTAQIEPS